jgi:hypothetical protein
VKIEICAHRAEYEQHDIQDRNFGPWRYLHVIPSLIDSIGRRQFGAICYHRFVRVGGQSPGFRPDADVAESLSHARLQPAPRTHSVKSAIGAL